MSDDLVVADAPKADSPKPVPKPGQLKPAGAGGSKKGSKDYKSLTGRQKAAIFLIFAVLMLVFKENMYINIAVSVLFVWAMFGAIYRFKAKHLGIKTRTF